MPAELRERVRACSAPEGLRLLEFFRLREPDLVRDGGWLGEVSEGDQLALEVRAHLDLLGRVSVAQELHLMNSEAHFCASAFQGVRDDGAAS